MQRLNLSDQDGKVKISFSENIRKHFNYTNFHLVDPPVLKFKLWSESLSKYREGAIKDWKVTNFGDNNIEVQITWTNPLEISAGTF